ncbi:MAG: 2Fe-2S iron-sulfur cluster-binding protein [Sulfitobacter sp.]
MPTTTPPRTAAPLMRSLRAFTGLILLAYVTLHLINLSLGLISIAAMDAARPYLSGFWTGPLTGLLLGLALLVHYFLGLRAVYQRPRITGTLQDAVQALSGLLVIPLLAVHGVGVFMLKEANVEIDYEMLNRLFWLSNPGIGLTQVLLVSVVWIHGCAGFFMWLRARPAAVRMLPWLYPLAVAVPILALLGYTQAGRIVLSQGLGPVFTQLPLPDGSAPVPTDNVLIKQVTYWVIWISAALGVFVLAARTVRSVISQPARVNISTQSAGTISAQSGQTLLDAFRAEGQAHANLCAGRGRCGTCAVRILNSDHPLPLPDPLEQATLDRLHKGPDVRLACQLRLEETRALDVERLYPPDFTFENRHEHTIEPRQEAPT